MAINGLNSGTGMTAAASSFESVTVSAEITKSTTATLSSSDAVVYKKGDGKLDIPVPDNHKIDFDTIDKLKADADERNAKLKGIVEQLLLKQGGTILNSTGLASIYRKLEVDDETRLQAQKDIADDGYWGIEQTSDRILDFAKALAGDNAEIAHQLLDAVKEGFKQAGREWGEDLPDISQKTMTSTLQKFKEWIDSLPDTSSASATISHTSSIKVSATYTKSSEVSVSAAAADTSAIEK